ncbi:MAG: type II toxin-antitoxin system YafQ family toxin [Clostridia bacterium]|nr:type II toxin-antitoxin system YafQ family toxin [Clostridia bacterium]
MLKIEYQTQFKRDYKQAIKRGFDVKKLMNVIEMLAEEKTLPSKYKDHKLNDSKEYKGMRECHIDPDWLLIYKVYKDKLVLQLIRTGSHSDLL